MRDAKFCRAAAALHLKFILTDEEVEMMVALVLAAYSLLPAPTPAPRAEGETQ